VRTNTSVMTEITKIAAEITSLEHKIEELEGMKAGLIEELKNANEHISDIIANSTQDRDNCSKFIQCSVEKIGKT